MNLKNTLHTTCPFCHTAFALDAENVRQADFRRKFGKWTAVTKQNLVKVLEENSSDLESDLFEEETESI